MEPKEQAHQIATKEDIPELEFLQAIPRGIRFKMIFSKRVESSREAWGNRWKRLLPGFQIGVHTSEPIVSILKLITDEEIDLYQEFFDRCAQDYRKLATELITGLAKQLAVEINPEFPLDTLNPYGIDYVQTGRYGAWRYAFHGFHCAFVHKKTNQYIEVPLIYGLEFGELDPYFFSGFINAMPEYRPLPIHIYSNYADGCRIIDRMLELGRFVKVNSNVKGDSGIAAKAGTVPDVGEYVPEANSYAKPKSTKSDNTLWQSMREWLKLP